MQSLFDCYDVIPCEYGYQFETNSGARYFITFVPYPTLSDGVNDCLYMFNIERANDKDLQQGQNDKRVRNTIVKLLAEFFKHNEQALIVVLDVLDGKQEARKRLFDQWFNMFNNGVLKRLEAPCNIEGEETYAMLYFRVDASNGVFFEEEFKVLTSYNFFN